MARTVETDFIKDLYVKATASTYGSEREAAEHFDKWLLCIQAGQLISRKYERVGVLADVKVVPMQSASEDESDARNMLALDGIIRIIDTISGYADLLDNTRADKKLPADVVATLGDTAEVLSESTDRIWEYLGMLTMPEGSDAARLVAEVRQIVNLTD